MTTLDVSMASIRTPVDFGVVDLASAKKLKLEKMFTCEH